MKVIIVRHGRTQSNIERRYCGCRSDDPLSEAGKEELADCSEQLSELGITNDECVLAASPMKRAIQTAKIMFPEITRANLNDTNEATIRTIYELREMDFGIFEGKCHAELDGQSEYQAWVDSGGTMQIPGGESMESFRQRTMEGLRKAISVALSGAAPDMDTAGGVGAKALIIVAHGGTVMAIMSALTGENYYDFYSDNGCGYTIDLEVDNAGNIIAAGAYDRFCGRIH